MKTTIYNIPSSEIPTLLKDMGDAFYWRPSSSILQQWTDGKLCNTEYESVVDPLKDLPVTPIQGTVVINGAIANTIPEKMAHQIIDAHFQGVNQHWILTWQGGEIPPDLLPFVEVKEWALPTGPEIAEILQDAGIFSDRLLRSCIGLHRGELAMLLHHENPERSVVAYKQKKLSAKGIQHIPEPDCKAAGNDNVMAVIDRVGRLLSPAAEAAGLPFPTGIILLGIPGSGKSLTAKMSAQRLGVPLICADWGGLISPIAGQSEANVRELVRVCEAAAPSILFFDDFDKAFASSDLAQENGAEKRIAGYLLTWLQEHRSKVFTIVTCNRITHLPPELKRRFDWAFNVDLPHEGQRYEIFRVHLERFCDRIPDWNEYEWKRVIQTYSQCTPDEIGKAVHKCAITAFERGEPKNITLDDILDQRSYFTPANLANPEQVAAIRLASKDFPLATSADNSVFRITPVPQFERMLGKNKDVAIK